MQLATTFSTFTFILDRARRTLTAWQSARARRADERIIQNEVDRLSLLGLHYLDDAGLTHLTPSAELANSRELFLPELWVRDIFPRA